MTKEELRSLTIEQLNGMTEEQLDVVANQVIELHYCPDKIQDM